MAATFPMALKVFTVFHDYTDVIWAYSINEIHDEVVAIEQALGLLDAPPTSAPPGTPPHIHNTPYTSFAGAIQDLYLNKAPTNHTHVHSTLVGDNLGNDHPQYIMVNGYPGFSAPVAGQNASAGNQLMPLGQLLSFGFVNAAEAEAMVEAATLYLMSGAFGGPPLAGPAVDPNLIVQGGLFAGCTDGNGQVFVPFGTLLGTVQSFVCTKMPPSVGPGAPPQPCPPYNWIEAQVTLVGISGYGAQVQFSHDYSWQPGMHVELTWIAIGMYN